jgi:hypothetical protein
VQSTSVIVFHYPECGILRCDLNEEIMSTTLAAAKTITVLQSGITLTGPVTVVGTLVTNGTKDWVDYLIAICSFGSIFVGLFAVWLAAKLARESDLIKRYFDVVISTSEDKYQGLLPVLNQLNMFVRTLEFGIVDFSGTQVLS